MRMAVEQFQLCKAISWCNNYVAGILAGETITAYSHDAIHFTAGNK